MSSRFWRSVRFVFCMRLPLPGQQHQDDRQIFLCYSVKIAYSNRAIIRPIPPKGRLILPRQRKDLALKCLKNLSKS